MDAHMLAINPYDHQQSKSSRADVNMPVMGAHTGHSIIEHISGFDCRHAWNFTLGVMMILHRVGLDCTVAYMRYFIMKMVVNYLSACMLVPPEMHEVARVLQNGDKPFRDFVLELADYMFNNMLDYPKGQYAHLRLMTMAECVLHAAHVAMPYAKKLTADEDAKKAARWWNDSNQLIDVHHRLYGDNEPPQGHFSWWRRGRWWRAFA